MALGLKCACRPALPRRRARHVGRDERDAQARLASSRGLMNREAERALAHQRSIAFASRRRRSGPNGNARRQSTEGRAFARAGDKAGSADPRRANAGRRCSAKAEIHGLAGPWSNRAGDSLISSELPEIPGRAIASGDAPRRPAGDSPAPTRRPGRDEPRPGVDPRRAARDVDHLPPRKSVVPRSALAAARRRGAGLA